MTNRRICLLLVLVSVGLATAFLQEKRTIWGEIQDRHELKKLRHLLEHDEFKEARDALDGQGAGQGLNITLFAPDNHAMKHAKHHFKIDKRFVGLIKMLLKYHVIEGEVRSTDFDQTASDSKHRKKLFIETCADDEHAVNLPNQSGQVLQLVKEGEKLYITYGLSKKKYHVNIVTKDIECSNGVLHVIDKVLLLPRRATTMASFEYLFGFVEGLIKFDLARSVNEETGVTAIVPTDEAWLKFFMAHGKQAEKEDVKNIFKYHITDEDDVFYSDRFRDPKGKKALNTKFGKDKLVIRVNQDGDVMINEKPVQVEDIITSNGVMHVVNQVLIPPTLQHKFAEPADEDEMEQW